MRVLLALLALPLVLVPVRAETPAQTQFKVKELHNIAYLQPSDGAKAGNHNCLDMYLPEAAKNYPVVVIVHGGAWMLGDKLLDAIPAIGRAFARQGIGAVGVNYRLSPAVQHPAHIEDLAQAFAWVHKHIGEYGGRGDKLFLMGHSAGGHLVALLGTDDRYLQAVGLSLKNVEGVIGVSGVYQISELAINLFGGRRAGSMAAPDAPKPFERIFGHAPNATKDVSPLAHVRPGLPPFLLFYAERDLPTLGLQAMMFNSALKANKCSTQLLEIDQRNHATVMWRAAQSGDPVMAAIMKFIHEKN